jgi:hypothetical protein
MNKEAVEAYCAAVGLVVYNWNDLHEKLARLFALVRGGDRKEALTKWYAIRSDRDQRHKLRKAVNKAPGDRWTKSPKAPDDLNWLLDCADELAERRNDAIHAPCSLYFRGDGSAEVLAAVRSAGAGNPRANNLKEKDLLVEFHLCAHHALTLGQLTERLGAAIASPDRYEWPERPKFPSAADFSGVSRRSERDKQA